MTHIIDNLYRRLECAQFEEHIDNHDELRFGPGKTHTIWDGVQFNGRRIARKLGWYHRSWLNVAKSSALREWTPLLGELDWVYQRLADDDSRNLLVDIIAYRIMGQRAVRLPLSNNEHRAKREALSKMGNSRDQLDIDFLDWKLKLYDLSPLGYPMKLYLTNPVTLFDVKQYEHDKANVRAVKDDVVIDGGGCFGDTATYFAHHVGPSGSVHVFEFVPSNISILERNLNLNPELNSRVTIAKHPIWNASDQNVYVRDRGPASDVVMEEKAGYDIKARTVTIDDYVKRAGLKRVDFIKLDIEGAEENALLGAEKTIREMRPKMAVCLYHSAKDFVRLPRLLDQYCPDYKFYIKHATMHAEETVLFVKV